MANRKGAAVLCALCHPDVLLFYQRADGQTPAAGDTRGRTGRCELRSCRTSLSSKTSPIELLSGGGGVGVAFESTLSGALQRTMMRFFPSGLARGRRPLMRRSLTLWNLGQCRDGVWRRGRIVSRTLSVLQPSAPLNFLSLPLQRIF